MLGFWFVVMNLEQSHGVLYDMGHGYKREGLETGLDSYREAHCFFGGSLSLQTNWVIN